MEKKWYFSTWFLMLLSAFSVYGFPLIIAIVLLVIRMKHEKDMQDTGYAENYIRNEMIKDELSADSRLSKVETLITKKKEELNSLQKQIIVTNEEILLQSFGFYEPKYNYSNSKDYMERLTYIRNLQKKLVKNKEACYFSDSWTLDGSKAKGAAMNNDNIKLALRAFNSECDSAIFKVKFNNLESIEKRMLNSFDQINKANQRNRIAIKPEYLSLKKQELNLAYEYELKKQAEKEEQKELAEQIREEARVQREIANEKKKIEKEEQHFSTELARLNQEKNKLDVTSQEYTNFINKITELESKLALLEIDKKNIFDREQNTRAGYVYIISNIGSFGENFYKIGVTRRLVPEDRVNELGSASVPFKFDIHAMIFSEDAPKLENALHKAFDYCKVNKVNNRKEFFRVSLEEIQKEVEKNHNKTVEFTLLAEAEEYRESLKIA